MLPPIETESQLRKRIEDADLINRLQIAYTSVVSAYARQLLATMKPEAIAEQLEVYAPFELPEECITSLRAALNAELAEQRKWEGRYL